ncbi:MAG: hypothetical protein IJX47_01930 [Clostridia bacterium]|nr:hypothetical protein [Clostridia bacterium]
MKRILQAVSALLLTALLLSACRTAYVQTATESTSRPDDGRDVTAVTTEPPTVTTTAPLTELPPETDVPAEPVTYPAWEGRSDIELLTEIDGSCGELLAVSGWKDRILLSYARWDSESGAPLDACVRLLNLTTGKLSEAAALPGAEYCAVFLENGRMCLYDQLSCVARVYDPAGNLRYSYESRDQSVGFSVDPAGDGTLWCYSGVSPVLTKVALDGSSVKQITVPDAEGGYIMGHREGVTYYSAWDGGNGKIYAVTPDGGVTRLAGAEGYYWNGGCLYTDQYPNRIVDPADMETVYQVQGEDAFSWVVAGEGKHLLVERYRDDGAGSAYWVLDYENALRYPALEADGECVYDHFYSPEEGVFCFTVSSYGEDGRLTDTRLCRWSYAHDAEAAQIIEFTPSETDLQNAEIAARIKETWGVSVIYTEPLIHQVASDYSTVAVTDPTKLNRALLQLEEALSAYPDGFFDDLCYGDYTVLELYLCGKFTPLTSAGITTAEALSNTRGTAMVIGFNVELMDGEYVRVLAHELLHVMERRIDKIDPDALAEWITLTPGGHDAYYYSYHDESGNEMSDLSNTYACEPNPADAYFVDAYSKSFPTEDRARIFEKLTESGGDPYFADAPVLMAKARTLCRIIREYFPSVAATERASWEVR